MELMRLWKNAGYQCPAGERDRNWTKRQSPLKVKNKVKLFNLFLTGDCLVVEKLILRYSEPL